MLNIKREKFVLRELKDKPFIVELKYTFQDFRNLYMVMEYLNGGSIANRI